MALMAFLVGGVGKLVLLLPGDFVVVGYGFGGQAHAHVVVGVRHGQLVVGHGLPAHGGHQAHALGAAGDDAVGHAHADFAHRHGNGFDPGAAVAVHDEAGHVDGQRQQRDEPAHLQALLGFGHGVADNYVVNPGRVEGGHLGHKVLDDFGGEVVGPGEAEASTRGFAHGGAVASDDVCLLGHGI